jgi:hypothetical protein
MNVQAKLELALVSMECSASHATSLILYLPQLSLWLYLITNSHATSFR